MRVQQVQQVSAFLENRPGRLLYLLNVLAEAQINLIAHNIVDASDFGIVHLLVDRPMRALEVIRDAGMTCSITTVLEAIIPNAPGVFAECVLKPLANASINIEYSYAYGVPSSDEAHIILKVDEIKRGQAVLQQQ